MDKPTLLALVAQQNSDLVAAINQLPDDSSLQSQVTAQAAEISAAEADLAKVSADLNPAPAPTPAPAS